MYHDLFPAIIVLGIFFAAYKIVELFVRRKERMAIIEKFNVANGSIPDISKWFPQNKSFSALRIGLLLVGLGLGMGIALIMSCYIPELNKEMASFALIMLFGGLGLVLAYFLEQKAK